MDAINLAGNSIFNKQAKNTTQKHQYAQANTNNVNKT
jgi:hypothetical protein